MSFGMLMSVFVIHGSNKREIEKGRKINHSQSVLNLKENGINW